VALGTAVSLELGLPLVIVRLDREAGSARMIEGELYAAEEITLIEDVVVTGSRALRAISRVSEAGARVRQVVSVLDRREGAAERFSEASVGYRHLFTPEELGLA
jgi:orotate phosphoribosyltransferase